MDKSIRLCTCESVDPTADMSDDDYQTMHHFSNQEPRCRGSRSGITVRRFLNRFRIQIRFHRVPFPEILDPGRPRSRTALGCSGLGCASLQVYAGCFYSNKRLLGEIFGLSSLLMALSN